MVYLAAAVVGGIEESSRSHTRFYVDNTTIQNNVLVACARAGVPRLCFLSSACAYPPTAPLPLTPDSILSGKFEPTNEGYSLAKVGGMRLCEYLTKPGTNFYSVLPCNLYGPGARPLGRAAHVVPALLGKLLGVGPVPVGGWSSRREFLYVDDFVDALLTLLAVDYAGPPVNVGSGVETQIADLARLCATVVGADPRRLMRTDEIPSGVSSKLLNSEPLRSLGWAPQMSLEAGLVPTAIYVKDFLAGAVSK